jgi:mono/diheme cytochrome c family protein
MRQTRLRPAPGAVGMVMVGLMLGCTASKKPSKVETALANMAKDVAIPIQARSLPNPVPASDEAISQGQQIYTQSCALCHGPDGRGGTDLGRNMYPPAMDLNSPHVQHWTDAELFWIIQNGVRLTGMPSWKSTLPEADTWKVVDFMRNLPRQNATSRAPAAPAPARQAAESQADLIAYGRTLYRQEGCFTCHRLDGEGTSLGPDLSTEGTRGRSDNWLMGHFKDPAKYSKGSVMPPFVNLSDAQLRALTAFLQNQKGRKEK